MQQFVVPQFIDVEDKIFGPITTRQFLILLAAGLLIFVFYKLTDFALFVTLTAVLGGLALVFAFVKINGQPFHYFLLNLLQTLRKPSLRVWKKNLSDEELNFLRKLNTEKAPEKIARKEVKSGHIHDLALLVNTGGFYKPEDEL
ncbi:MAG: hypothetical protein US42_C0003G0052 [Candidatus Magasanikbacteria bacterium GW2011_GWC2_37_14]|uniref:PrgI family protein n=1 Tax=Candidatus Magasanikbacteria bacterium GW2011_GWC2_37_14 TaxID=1619046 RepID=A0A0G0GPA4_9BACT|nr:MAG: hypothetical protein US42_C0003G0052 [Candidatus Magasanikbacteria bacterium GW2011_GWC2_37_14]